MNNIKGFQITKLAVIASLVAIVGLACLCLPSSATPTSIPPVSDTPTPVVTEPALVGGLLNAQGPWLLVETRQGLWASNPDGSGLTQLTTVDYWNGDLANAVEPNGRQVAFISAGNYDFHNMALNVLYLPEGNVVKIADLTSSTTEAYADSAPGDPGFEALRAVGEERSFAWSADGLKLAFGAVLDGPAAQIYIFDERLMHIQAVSQDDSQHYWPSWSPDGQHLLYLAAEGFGSGAGGVMSGVWVADGSGDHAAQLFPSDSAGMEVEGWLTNDIVLLANWDQPCGLQMLKLYDVINGNETSLHAGCYHSAAADGVYGEGLFADDTGIYQVTADDFQPTQIDTATDANIDPRRHGDQVFTVRFQEGGIATFGTISDYAHQVSPVNVPSGELDVAEYGAIWGWTSTDAAQPGAWITGPGLEFGQIFPDPALLPIWSADNNLLFFSPQDSGGHGLYLVTFDSHYSDLHLVNHLDADPIRVVWLNGE